MIRRTTIDEFDGQQVTTRTLPRISCVTWFISPGLPEGVVNWPAYAEEDVTRWSVLSVQAFQQAPPRSCVEFNTADPVDARREWFHQNNERQELGDTLAYLNCRRRAVDPGPRLQAAWDRFFRLYTRRIQRAAQCHGLSGSDVEDCVQEVWLVILDVLRPAGHGFRWERFAGWMHALIRNQVVSFVRATARQPVQWAESLDDTMPGHDEGPRATCERRERRRLVRHVLTHLKQQVSETNYELVYCRWIEEREVPDVAARLALTCEQVWYRQHRGKEASGTHTRTPRRAVGIDAGPPRATASTNQ